MSATRFLSALIGAFSAAVLAAPSRVTAVDATWISFSGGAWSNAANWSGGVVPQNNVGTVFNVFIDDGQVSSVMVEISNASYAIGTLTISQFDRLRISTFNSFSSLGLTGSQGIMSQLSNAGTIHVSSVGGPARLNASARDWFITGGGTIRLSGDAQLYGNPAGLVTNANNLIFGEGSIGLDRTRFVNQGTIRANVPGKPLTVDPLNAAYGFTNSGTMSAIGGGILLLTPNGGGGGFVNTGLIEASGDDSIIRLSSDGFVHQGTLRASAGAQLDMIGHNLGSFDSTGGAIEIFDTATFTTVFPILNAGSIQLDGVWNANGGSISAGAVVGSGVLNHVAGATSLRQIRVPTVSISGGSVTIASGGGTEGTSRTVAPSITQSGRLNLTDHDMVIDHDGTSPIETIRDYLRSGYNAGQWDGPGIITTNGTSSGYSIGYAGSASLFSSFPAEFSGQLVDDTTLLLKFTRFGDSDLNGTVNLADFNRLAANFGTSAAFWHGGDFSYDGMVDLQDFNLLAGNFGLMASGTHIRADDWAALSAVVPEPVLCLLLPLALLARRNRAARSRHRATPL